MVVLRFFKEEANVASFFAVTLRCSSHVSGYYFSS